MTARLRAVVRLNDVDAERQAPTDVGDKAHGAALVAHVVHRQDPNARAVVDGGELIETRPRAGNALEKLHINLQAVAGLGLLVALPALRVRSVLLIRDDRAYRASAREKCREGRPTLRRLHAAHRRPRRRLP